MSKSHARRSAPAPIPAQSEEPVAGEREPDGAFTPESALSWAEAGGNGFAVGLMGGQGEEDPTPTLGQVSPDQEGVTPPPDPGTEDLATPTAGGANRRIGLTMQQAYAAPSGGIKRTKVGVGEPTYFIAHDKGGRWTSTGGKGTTTKKPRQYDTYEWTAPATAGTYKVKYTATDSATLSVTMTVVTPKGMSAVSKTDKSYGSGIQGAGMKLKVAITPNDVSFQGADWREKAGPATQIQGYFKGKSKRKMYHNPTKGWIGIGAKNQVGDDAYYYGWPSPWKPGSYTWSIPNQWRVGRGSGTPFHTSTQVMAITDNRGTSTVSKFGQTATRAP
jgi:hypothetical protein